MMTGKKLYAGAKTIALAATPERLAPDGTRSLTAGVVLRADDANGAAGVRVGASSAGVSGTDYYLLLPGKEVPIGYEDVGDIWAKAAADGDIVYWIGA